MNSNKQQSQHATIDVLKGLLVIGMVTSHVNVFYGRASVVSTILKTAVNLVSFSGFLFCFGYAAYHAYLRQNQVGTTTRLLVGSARLFAAFVVSSATYSLFRDKTLNWERFFEIISLHYLPLYNEFLVAFLFISLLTLIGRQFLRWMLVDIRRWGLVTGCCVLITQLPTPKRLPLLAMYLVGATGTSIFPVVQYFPFYLAGVVYASGYRLQSRWMWGTAVLLSVGAAGWAWHLGDVPARFPPSVAWLAGAVLPIFCLGWLAQRLVEKPNALVRWLAHLGANVLFYLVLSNIALFAYTRVKYSFGIGGSFLVSATLLATLTFLSTLVRPSRLER